MGLLDLGLAPRALGRRRRYCLYRLGEVFLRRARIVGHRLQHQTAISDSDAISTGTGMEKTTTKTGWSMRCWVELASKRKYQFVVIASNHPRHACVYSDDLLKDALVGVTSIVGERRWIEAAPTQPAPMAV
jgi:hypothetical protein